jgi:hypothetical protein
MAVRYIFSVSTGRAGSNYLAELFGHVDRCVAEHEPRPILNDRPMRAFLAGDPTALERLMPAKVAAIRRAMVAASATTYVETNHCFIKGFGWLLPELLPEDELGVVVLRRDPARIKASLSRILCTPFLPAGDQWMITPAARPHFVPLPPEFSFPMARFHAYRLASRTIFRPGIVRRATAGRMNVIPPIKRYEDALLDWYIAEIEARWQAYRVQFPKVTAVEVDVDELNTPDGVAAMMARFGLAPKDSIREVLGRATNTKAHKRAVG